MAKAPNNKLVFVDDDNDAIKDAGEIVAYWRGKFETEYDGNGELTASDDKLLATLQAVPGDESKADQREAIRVARWEALLTLVEEVQYQTPSAVDSPLGRLAIEIGSKIDTATDKLVSDAVDNKEKYEGAPLEIAEHLVPLFGGELDTDGTVIGCQYILENFPWPGSKQSEAPAGSNQRFDRYEWIDQSGTPHPGYFMGDLHDSTPEGSDIRARLEAIKLLKADPTSSKIGFGYRTAFLVNNHIDPVKRDSEEQYLRNRKTSRINRMTRAIKYIMNAARLKELKDVTYTFVQDEKEKRYRANKPIKLLTGSGKKTVPHDRPLSLSQFINMRIDEAIRLGGTMANLLGTMKRNKPSDAATKQGGGKDALEGPKGTPTPEWMEAHMNNFVTAYMGETEEEKKIASINTSKLMSYLNKPGPATDELIETLRDYADIIQSILAHYGPRLEQIAKRKAKAA